MKNCSSGIHLTFSRLLYPREMNKYLVLCFFLISIFAVAAEESLTTGQVLPSFKAKDQHGQEFELRPGVRRLFVSFDMSTGKDANAYFASKGAHLLKDGHAVFVSNIHGMPAVGRLFALPKMRKYPHRIILADSENLLSRYPRQKDRITVLSLDSELKIAAVTYWNPKEEIPAELAKSPAN